MECVDKKYRRTTKQHLQCFVEFMKERTDLLTGKNSPVNPNCQEMLWQIKLQLSGKSNWKKQLRARARKAKAERQKTGGGAFIGEELLEFEQQALSIFGMSAVNGIGSANLGFEVTQVSAASPTNNGTPSPSSDTCSTPPYTDCFYLDLPPSSDAATNGTTSNCQLSPDACTYDQFSSSHNVAPHNSTVNTHLSTEDISATPVSVRKEINNITKQQLYEMTVCQGMRE